MKWAEQVQDRLKWKDIVEKAKNLLELQRQRRRREEEKEEGGEGDEEGEEEGGGGGREGEEEEEMPMDNNKALRSETNKHPKSPSFTITYREKGKAEQATTKELKVLKMIQEQSQWLLNVKYTFHILWFTFHTNDD